MLCEIYIEALLIDEEVADQVEAMLSVGQIRTDSAALAWWLVAHTASGRIEISHALRKLLEHFRI